MVLPAVESPEQLARLRGEVAPWRGALDAIRAQHHILGAPAAAASGTQPVFLFPDAVVKLYAPASLWGAQGIGAPDHDVEHSTLTRLEEHALPAPRIIGDGKLGDWPYLVVTRVPGSPIEEVLPRQSPSAAQRLMRQLGATIASLHSVPTPGVTTAVDDFETFMADQARDIVTIERRRGAAETWLRSLPRFVDDTPRGDADPVLLHTELGPGHTLVADAALTGIIDWAETIVGDAEYDLAAVAFFIARGDRALFGAFLDGYGWSGPRGETLARRLLRYLLLHRYAPLSWLLEQRPVPAAKAIADLAVPWMGLA